MAAGDILVGAGSANVPNIHPATGFVVNGFVDKNGFVACRGTFLIFEIRALAHGFR